MTESTDASPLEAGSKPKGRRRRGCAKLLLVSAVAAVLLGGAWKLANREPTPVPVAIAPTAMKAVGTVSDRYLSYNVEMVELTGGRFWRPYKDGKRKGDDRYEYRAPFDLSNPQLVKLAAALGPAYVRFSGTWANATFFDPTGATGGKAPKGFDGVLTGEQWRRAVAFTKAVDGQIVTSFATSPGARDGKGVWQSANASQFMAFTKDLGVEIAAAEFANEPETVDLVQAPKDYTPEQYRRDYGRFYEWMRQTSPSTKILAPGVAELEATTQFLRRWASGLRVFDREDLIAAGSHRPDAVSFHFYGGGSQRCGEIPVLGYGKGDALTKKWLGLVDNAISTTAGLRDKVAPGAPLWLTETADTACGGNPWGATFLDVFRFSDQVARSARQGVQVYIHNTLTASDYGLIDEKTHSPRPNYWAAYLWRSFMGAKVLDAGRGTSGLHVYAHCLRGHPGGVAVLAINIDEQRGRTLRVPTAGELYAMRQGSTPAQATLNGVPLGLGADGNLPALRGAAIKAGALELAPASINYLTFPDARNAACS